MAPRSLQHIILDCTVSSTLPLESAKAISSFRWFLFSMGRSTESVCIQAASSCMRPPEYVILLKANILQNLSKRHWHQQCYCTCMSFLAAMWAITTGFIHSTISCCFKSLSSAIVAIDAATEIYDTPKVRSSCRWRQLSGSTDKWILSVNQWIV